MLFSTEAMRMPSIMASEKGRKMTRPITRQRPAYSTPIRKSLRNTPGCFSGLPHMEGSMMRSASTCLHADNVISVMMGIRATTSIGPTGGVADAKTTSRLMAMAQVNMARGCLRNRRNPSRTQSQPDVAGRNAACMAL
ncbi:hypothetical protein H4P35_08855 [Achromobacter sp. 77]|nr:hypothetical protein H4P35_08855 [Achromobacter sp. 77]